MWGSGGAGAEAHAAQRGQPLACPSMIVPNPSQSSPAVPGEGGDRATDLRHLPQRPPQAIGTQLPHILATQPHAAGLCSPLPAPQAAEWRVWR